MNNHLQVVVPNNQTGETGRTVLWVSDLPEHVKESDLEAFFQDYKDSILIIQINRNTRNYDPYAPKPASATVIFRDHKRADEARRGLNLRKFRGKTVRIMWHEKDTSIRYNPLHNLFVKNIPSNVKPREFYEKFLEFGDIASAKVGQDDDGNITGYGYVSYYNPESCEQAISTLDGKELWGQELEVKRFQKKNERFTTTSLSTNKNIYLKNLPQDITENGLKDLFNKYGNITWCKIMLDSNQRKSAIISYDKEESANKAIEDMNGKNIDGSELYVDSLQKKQDRKKILSTKINDNNFKLNSMFKNCNLHVKNIPLDANEELLIDVFSKFGEIKSIKIPKYLLVTKVGNEFVEQPTSKGFAYVCFSDPEEANRAREELNGKTLPGFEKKAPLLISNFMPKHEREQAFRTMGPGFKPGEQMNMMYQPFGGMMPFQHPISRHIDPNQMMQQMPQMMPQHFQQQPQQRPKKPKHLQQQVQQVQTQSRTDDPDLKYLESLEDETAKKDYLGEFIFKKIENHPYSQSKNFTIDTIGKITGMILGIDDISEIVDITMNPDNLSARINEALILLEGQN
jgi:polyadenylate-binding protein